jgi:integrase
LRIGEFTWNSWTIESALVKLSRQSVHFTDDGNVILHLPFSKTDQFRQGHRIPLAPSYDSTCPVTALRSLFQKFPAPLNAPLFARSFGPFSYEWVISRVHSLLLAAGVSALGFSGHSFRRGAAISALEAGVPRMDIMKMGRWKSDAVDRYFDSTSNTSHLLRCSGLLHSQPGHSTPTPESRHISRSLSTPNSRSPGRPPPGRLPLPGSRYGS